MPMENQLLKKKKKKKKNEIDNVFLMIFKKTNTKKTQVVLEYQMRYKCVLVFHFLSNSMLFAVIGTAETQFIFS